MWGCMRRACIQCLDHMFLSFPLLPVEGRGKGRVNYLQFAWIHGISISQT